MTSHDDFTASPEYAEGFGDFVARGDTMTVMADYLRANSTALGLDTATCFVSIGPAAGDLDSVLLSQMPQCHTYYGVDVSEPSLLLLTQKMNKEHPDVNVMAIADRGETWPGPSQPADLVVMSHVLYHMPERQASIARALDWLRPGGKLLIGLGSDNVVTRTGRDFKPDYAGVQYRQPELRQDLLDMGAQAMIEDDVDITRDLRNPSKTLVQFLVRRAASDEQLKEIRRYLEENYPKGKDIEKDWITVLEK